VREDGGGIFGGRGYKDRIHLPIELKEWGIAEASIDFDEPDERRAHDILITDLDGNEVVIPQKERKGDWYRARSR
jgi:hypothetical protein